jgi:hypothetical protein
VAPLYLQKLAITSPTSGGRSVGIVRWRTQTMEFSLVLWVDNQISQMCNFIKFNISVIIAVRFIPMQSRFKVIFVKDEFSSNAKLKLYGADLESN